MQVRYSPSLQLTIEHASLNSDNAKVTDLLPAFLYFPVTNIIDLKPRPGPCWKYAELKPLRGTIRYVILQTLLD